MWCVRRVESTRPLPRKKYIKNNPGKPVITSVNRHATKLSKNIDHVLQPLAKEIMHYIHDTTDFLNKIKYIKIIPQENNISNIYLWNDALTNDLQEVRTKLMEL